MSVIFLSIIKQLRCNNLIINQSIDTMLWLKNSDSYILTTEAVTNKRK